MSAPAVDGGLETLTALLEDVTPDLRRVAEQVAQQYEDGDLTLEIAAGVLAIVIAAGNEQAAALGAAHTAATLTARGLPAAVPAAAVPARTAVAPAAVGSIADRAPSGLLVSGAVPPMDYRRGTDRLDAAARIVLKHETGSVSAAGRLAVTEALDAAREAQMRALLTSPAAGSAVGWRRVLDFKPCPTCVDWSAGGTVFALTSSMPTHPRCGCTREIVFEGDQ